MIQVLFSRVMVVNVLLLVILIGCSNSSKEDISKTRGTFKNIEITEKDSVKVERVLNKIDLRIPDGLNEMSERELAEKYPLNVRPSVAYSNEDMSATLTFKTIPKGIELKNLEDLQPVIANQFSAVYPQLKWLSKEVVEVHSKKFLRYEFTVPTANANVYSLVYISDVEKDLLITTFSCVENQTRKWKSAINRSMNSIREF